MLRISLAALALVPSAYAQSVYDFNQLTGSNTHPFTLLDGQDGWSEETFAAANRCGVTATLSHDGTQSLRFQESGPGYGCDASRINDANWFYPPFTGNEVNAYFQADILVGWWGGSFGPAYDTNLDGIIRGYQGGERGVRFSLGGQSNVQLQLIAADGTSVRVPLSNVGKTGDWLRIRVVMDLVAASGTGLGSVAVQNLSAGATDYTPVPFLQNVPLGLNLGATNATNPVLWDAVWLHFEGATYGLDNLELGRDIAWAIPYGSGCGSPPVGLRGVARPVMGTAASVETYAIPASSTAGLLFFSFLPIDPGIDLTGIGMPSCFLSVPPDVSIGFTPAGAAVLHTFPIPRSFWLAGTSVYFQSVLTAPGVNSLGVLTSNGLRWIIDVR